MTDAGLNQKTTETEMFYEIVAEEMDMINNKTVLSDIGICNKLARQPSLISTLHKEPLEEADFFTYLGSKIDKTKEA